MKLLAGLALLAVPSLTVPAAAQTAPTASPAPTPDYAQDAAWLCRPGRADACAVNQDVTVIQANGKRKIEKFKAAATPQFDCFYVYPTVSNDPTPNSDMTAGPEELAVAASQAARFASTRRAALRRACRVNRSSTSSTSQTRCMAGSITSGLITSLFG